MADLWGNLEGRRRGGADLFDNGPAGVILTADFFDGVADVLLYQGVLGWSEFYKGVRSDAALYKGSAFTLFDPARP